jgi:hypothetical protein
MRRGGSRICAGVSQQLLVCKSITQACSLPLHTAGLCMRSLAGCATQAHLVSHQSLDQYCSHACSYCPRYMPQIISSAIGNAPPPAAVVKALSASARAKDLDGVSGIGRHLDCSHCRLIRSYLSANGQVLYTEGHGLSMHPLSGSPGSRFLFLSCGISPPSTPCKAEHHHLSSTHYSLSLTCIYALQETREMMVNVFGVKDVVRAARNYVICCERAWVPGAPSADGALVVQVGHVMMCEPRSMLHGQGRLVLQVTGCTGQTIVTVLTRGSGCRATPAGLRKSSSSTMCTHHPCIQHIPLPVDR